MDLNYGCWLVFMVVGRGAGGQWQVGGKERVGMGDGKDGRCEGRVGVGEDKRGVGG